MPQVSLDPIHSKRKRWGGASPGTPGHLSDGNHGWVEEWVESGNLHPQEGIPAHSECQTCWPAAGPEMEEEGQASNNSFGNH